MTAHPPHGGVVTIGKFDGVHVGHRALLRRTVLRARALDAPTVAVTFDRHPMALLRPGTAPPAIIGLAERMRLLRSAGADHVLVLRFDRARAGQSPADFVGDILQDRLGARAVVVGTDFRFGHRAAGDVTLLADLLRPAGVEVEAVAKVALPGLGVVSSTAVRTALAHGDLVRAAALLGRSPGHPPLAERISEAVA